MREGALRYDSDLDSWCFDEGFQIETIQPGDTFRIRYLDHYQRGKIHVSESGEWQVIFGGAKKARQWILPLQRGQMYPAKLEILD